MRHTPGPWVFKFQLLQKELLGYEPSIQQVIAKVKTEDGLKIAEIYDTAFTDMNAANASLIAAAPELLTLARLILKEWEAPTEGIQKGELIARLSQYSTEAREVIAKAEGKLSSLNK